MGNLIARWVLRHPKLIIVVGLVVTVATGYGVTRLTVNNDLKDIIAHDNPVRISLDKLNDVFGSSETIVLQVSHPSREVFSPEFLNDIVTVSKRLKRLKGVSMVQSLATAERFERDAEGGLQIEKILEQKVESPEQAAAVKEAVYGDDDIRNAFVSVDGASVAIYVDPRPKAVDEEVLAEIRKTVAEKLDGYAVNLAGMAVVREGTNHVIFTDLAVLAPLVSLVLVAILWFSLRTVSGVVFTLLLITLSIVPAAGVMGLLGIPLSAQTTTFPVLILAIVVGDSIHVISTYYQRLRGGQSREGAVESVVRELSLPVFLTSATSSAGFLGMLSSPLPPMAGLGVSVAVGIMWAWGLSAFVLPATLLLLPAPRLAGTREDSKLDKSIDRFVSTFTGSPRLSFAIVFGVVILVSAIGFPMVKREVDPQKIFPAQHPIRASAEAIDHAFRSSAPVELLVEGEVNDPQLFKKIERFSQRVNAFVEVGSVDSAANIVSRITETLTGTPGIPDDSERLGQSLLLYSMSGSPDRYQRLVSTDGKDIRVTIRMPTLDVEALEAVLAKIEKVRAEEFAGVTTIMTGNAILTYELSHLVVTSAVSSILLALGLVFVICAISFRSLLTGFHAMLPLAIAVLGVFAAMGLTGIPLTVATALITSIVIGVGVDFGIHFLARWNLLSNMADTRVRAHETVIEVGRPILFNTLAVAGGLSVLSFSEFEPIRQLGLMAVFAMVASGFGAVVILPLVKLIRYREDSMKKTALTLIALFALSGTAEAADPKEILHKAQTAGAPKTMQSTMVMELKDSGGRAKTRALKLQKSGDDKQIVWFVQPADLAGTAFLRLGDAKDRKMWLYLPAFKKLERISGSKENESFLGSDFTYADMADRDLDDFDHKLLGDDKLDGKSVVKIESTLKGDDEDAPYAKVVSYIEKDSNRLLREDLYDINKELVKRKTHENFKKIGSYVIPSMIVMKDLTNDHITSIETKGVEVDKKIADSVFTTEAMKRLRP